MGFIRKTWNKVTGKDKLEAEMNKAPPPPPAVTAGVAEQKTADTTVVETTSDKATAAKKGKKSLKVARSSGTGVNV